MKIPWYAILCKFRCVCFGTRGGPVKKLKLIVSLTNRDNDYQMEQATDAEQTAQRLGVDIQILDAENDAILQSQQLLKIIQSNTEAHPDGIIFEPVGGTAMPQVARAAAAAGIGWVVLNREVEYINELRSTYKVPIFSISSDHATIVVPANTGKAIEMLTQALNTGTLPPAKTLTVAQSFPAIEELSKKLPKTYAAKVF